jgi:hypothetical protein
MTFLTVLWVVALIFGWCMCFAYDIGFKKGESKKR